MSPQIFPRDLVFDMGEAQPKGKNHQIEAGSRARDPSGGGGVPPPSPLNLLDLLDLVELADLLDLLDLLDPKQSTPWLRPAGAWPPSCSARGEAGRRSPGWIRPAGAGGRPTPWPWERLSRVCDSSSWGQAPCDGAKGAAEPRERQRPGLRPVPGQVGERPQGSSTTLRISAQAPVYR